mmetsp:Transcript_27200/g.68529  ORF Transcript_27200/g.68529 Transcript_27200/m.68529 type:complete len:246 (-) Transcript_27200:176-913(-)
MGSYTGFSCSSSLSASFLAVPYRPPNKLLLFFCLLQPLVLSLCHKVCPNRCKSNNRPSDATHDGQSIAPSSLGMLCLEVGKDGLADRLRALVLLVRQARQPQLISDALHHAIRTPTVPALARPRPCHHIHPWHHRRHAPHTAQSPQPPHPAVRTAAVGCAGRPVLPLGGGRRLCDRGLCLGCRGVDLRHIVGVSGEGGLLDRRLHLRHLGRRRRVQRTLAAYGISGGRHGGSGQGGLRCQHRQEG